MKKKVTSPFSKNLAKVLKERKLTQKACAEIVGCRPSVINDWLSGAQPHDLSSVLRLCQSLKVDFQWLVTGEHSKPSIKEVSLNELFDIEDEPSVSGLYQIEAKRLRRKK